MKKNIIYIIIIGLVGTLLAGAPAFSYFQHTFYCSFTDGSLQIATTYFANAKLCLNIVGQLRDRKTEIKSQLDGLSGQGESAYNTSVRATLSKQASDIDKLTNQMISGVNNLEARLYTNNKKKYFPQLRSIRSRLIAKQAVLSADLAHSVSDGEAVLVGKIINTIGFNYQRIKIIEGILASKSLDEMMPLLAIYKNLIQSQLPGKSE